MGALAVVARVRATDYDARTPSVRARAESPPPARAPSTNPVARVPLAARPSESAHERVEPPAGARAARDAERAELAMLARDPAALEARAAELLSGAEHEAEALLLLAYLRAERWPTSVFWHETAVRTGRSASDAAGVGLAEVALGALGTDAPDDPAAGAALERLAFATPELALGLRRRAASFFAATTDAAGLLRLEFALAREDDAVLGEGCLVAVAARASEPARTRLLAAHGRDDAVPLPADE